jgi:hypothetical protein
MYSVEADRNKRLIVISASGEVTEEDVRAAAAQVRGLLKDAEPGIRALTDLRWLTAMEPGAARYIAEIMDVLRETGLVSVTRVMPDPHKDIGFNILSQFHYDSKVQIYTFATLAEAIQSLIENEN